MVDSLGVSIDASLNDFTVSVSVPVSIQSLRTLAPSSSRKYTAIFLPYIRSRVFLRYQITPTRITALIYDADHETARRTFQSKLVVTMNDPLTRRPLWTAGARGWERGFLTAVRYSRILCWHHWHKWMHSFRQDA